MGEARRRGGAVRDEHCNPAGTGDGLMSRLRRARLPRREHTRGSVASGHGRAKAACGIFDVNTSLQGWPPRPLSRGWGRERGRDAPLRAPPQTTPQGISRPLCPVPILTKVCARASGVVCLWADMQSLVVACGGNRAHPAGVHPREGTATARLHPPPAKKARAVVGGGLVPPGPGGGSGIQSHAYQKHPISRNEGRSMQHVASVSLSVTETQRERRSQVSVQPREGEVDSGETSARQRSARELANATTASIRQPKRIPRAIARGILKGMQTRIIQYYIFLGVM